MAKRKASNQIAKWYRESIRIRGYRPEETFINPMTKKEEENSVGIPVRLLNELLREKGA